ncbi:hypothetical protein L6164_011126 [Bauhinia variegata]|uniref:Uncharacterized protein n=1 Tax=Bauhinia variegata TaxID=167791 RepID=A0ACB9P789_BAUVA|nr:hypothetical protein L6164_011126 [Bauhinia variegata]
MTNPRWTPSLSSKTLAPTSASSPVCSTPALLPTTSAAASRPSPSKSKWKSLCGPWVVHAAGAVQCFIGFFFTWASVVGLIHRPPVAVMCFFAWLAADGQTFLNTTNVVTGLLNFPQYGGTIVGIMKGFLGLGGAIPIQLYYTFCDGEPTTYLLMLACYPTFIFLSLMFLVRIYEVHDSDYKKYLNGFYAACIIIVAYLVLITILRNILTFPSWARVFTFVVLVILLASPFGIAIRAQWEESRNTYSIARNPLTNNPKLIASSSYPPAGDNMEYHELPSGEERIQATSDDSTLPYEVEMNLLQAMCTVEFWMLFTTMVSGMGSGLATVNNLILL